VGQGPTLRISFSKQHKGGHFSASLFLCAILTSVERGPTLRETHPNPVSISSKPRRVGPCPTLVKHVPKTPETLYHQSIQCLRWFLCQITEELVYQVGITSSRLSPMIDASCLWPLWLENACVRHGRSPERTIHLTQSRFASYPTIFIVSGDYLITTPSIHPVGMRLKASSPNHF